jgi:CubicO group peptidase (beta-lactamase class C family)
MADDYPSHWNDLGEFVAPIMERKQIPGAAVGILHEERIACAGFGVTSVEHPLPVTDTTLFQIGSITKTFLGTAIMRLVERGDIALEARVRSYIPDFALADEEAAAGATVRHLLTHTGGWAGDFFHDAGSGEDAVARYVADMADLPQLAPLGTHWSYNNAGFSVLGRILEVVTGQQFEAAMRELVLEPLGLDDVLLDPGDVITHRFAVGHHKGDEGPRVAQHWGLGRATYPMGGLVCHVQDLLRYARFHLGDGRAPDDSKERLLSAETLALMQSPQVTLWGKEAWGLPWSVVEIGGGVPDEEGPGVRQVSHGGGTKGQISLLALVPERDFALAVLTNGDGGGRLTDEVRRWALREVLDIEDAKPQPIDADEQELAQYAGKYRGYFADLELGMLAGRLVGQVSFKRGFPTEDVAPPPAPPPMTVGLCEPDRLLILDGDTKGDRVDVIRKEDGSIGWLRRSGRLHVRTKA